MDSWSYQLGRLYAQSKKFRIFLAILFYAGLVALYVVFSGVLKNPSGYKSVPVAASVDDCATTRMDKYKQLMEKKDFWAAGLQMTPCASRVDRDDYKKLEMAAELAHYQQEIALSGRDKARKMAAINSMTMRGHPVSDALVAELRQYEKAEAERAKAAEAKLRKSQGVSIGMTKEEVLASSWGRPQRVNKTTRASGVSEQWVYGYNYLYFEDGVLKTIQH